MQVTLNKSSHTWTDIAACDFMAKNSKAWCKERKVLSINSSILGRYTEND